MAFLRRKSNALTASTASVALGRGGSWSSWKYGNREWQAESWRLYDIVGELRFLASWIGDSVSQAKLYVTKVNEQGEETGAVNNKRIAELASIPLGTGSQRDDNLRLLGIDLAVPGEAWVVGEGGATSEPEAWYVLTSGQIKRLADDTVVQRPLTLGGDRELRLREGVDTLTRVWRPHPNDIWQPDSPTRSAIPPLKEIELVTKRQFAELESRMVGAGVWFLPESVDLPRGEDDPPGIAGGMAYLARVAAMNIQDQASASARVPIISTIPDHLAEHLDKWKEPANFWSELSEQIMPMKEKAIGRVASSFEIPSELLTGLSTGNHWSAWAVSEEGIKRIKPYLAYIADALTRGFLVPALERAEIPDAHMYCYAFDVAPLSVRPNRLPEALDLWDRGLISDQQAVLAGAFTEDQMPAERDRLRSLAFRALANNPALIADPVIQAIIGVAIPRQIEVITAPAIEEKPEDDDPEDENSAPDDENDDDEGNEPRPGQAKGTTVMFQTAARLMVLRALELAGGRLTSPGDRRRWSQIPRHELHSRVGPITPDKADRVLEGAWLHLEAVADELGVPPEGLERILHGYCRELLTRGMCHHNDLLDASLVHLRRAVA